MENKIYVIGGQEDKASAVDILDLGTGEWLTGPDLLHDVRYPKVATAGHNIYVLNDSDGDVEAQIPIQCLDTRTDTWSLLTFLPPSVTNTAEVPMFYAENTLYCLAPTCLQYNITSGKWMDMAQHEYSMQPSSTPVRMGNKVVVCGGGDRGYSPLLIYH